MMNFTTLNYPGWLCCADSFLGSCRGGWIVSGEWDRSSGLF
jgi:hypothetical protein